MKFRPSALIMAVLAMLAVAFVGTTNASADGVLPYDANEAWTYADLGLTITDLSGVTVNEDHNRLGVVDNKGYFLELLLNDDGSVQSATTPVALAGDLEAIAWTTGSTYYILDEETNSIYQYDSILGTYTLHIATGIAFHGPASDPDGLEGLSWDPTTSTTNPGFFVVNERDNGAVDSEIYKISPSGSVSGPAIVPSGTDAAGMWADSNGDFYVVSEADEQVVRFSVTNWSTGTTTVHGPVMTSAALTYDFHKAEGIALSCSTERMYIVAEGDGNDDAVGYYTATAAPQPCSQLSSGTLTVQTDLANGFGVDQSFFVTIDGSATSTECVPTTNAVSLIGTDSAVVDVVSVTADGTTCAYDVTQNMPAGCILTSGPIGTLIAGETAMFTNDCTPTGPLMGVVTINNVVFGNPSGLQFGFTVTGSGDPACSATFIQITGAGFGYVPVVDITAGGASCSYVVTHTQSPNCTLVSPVSKTVSANETTAFVNNCLQPVMGTVRIDNTVIGNAPGSPFGFTVESAQLGSDCSNTTAQVTGDGFVDVPVVSMTTNGVFCSYVVTQTNGATCELISAPSTTVSANQTAAFTNDCSEQEPVMGTVLVRNNVLGSATGLTFAFVLDGTGSNPDCSLNAAWVDGAGYTQAPVVATTADGTPCSYVIGMFNTAGCSLMDEPNGPVPAGQTAEFLVSCPTPGPIYGAIEIEHTVLGDRLGTTFEFAVDGSSHGTQCSVETAQIVDSGIVKVTVVDETAQGHTCAYAITQSKIEGCVSLDDAAEEPVVAGRTVSRKSNCSELTGSKPAFARLRGAHDGPR